MPEGKGRSLLILASSSPRRRELLSRFGLSFLVAVPDVDESIIPGESPEDHVRRLAAAKATEVAGKTPEGIVVAADTVVVLDGEIIGKPGDSSEAGRMLGRLAGHTHRVCSGVAVADAASGKVRTEVVGSLVTMSPIDTAEIRKYVDTGEPLDKAGAYAVQGLGGKYVSKVEGSLTNVIGLPLRELQGLLAGFGCLLPLPEGRL